MLCFWNNTEEQKSLAAVMLPKHTGFINTSQISDLNKATRVWGVRLNSGGIRFIHVSLRMNHNYGDSQTSNYICPVHIKLETYPSALVILCVVW